MASSLSPTYAYTVVYVKDVAKSVAFYAKAFGYSVRRLDNSRRWGELESGPTTIAFTPIHQHETDEVTGLVHTAQSKHERGPIEVCFDYADVDAAYKGGGERSRGGELSRSNVGEVGYVRDIDGMIVRLGSNVAPPNH